VLGDGFVSGFWTASLLKGELAFLSKGVVVGGLTGWTLLVFCVVSLAAADEASFTSAFAGAARRTGVLFGSADFFSDLFFMFAGQIHHPRAAVSTFAAAACNRKYIVTRKAVSDRLQQ
jgi:hypothetical protein